MAAAICDGACCAGSPTHARELALAPVSRPVRDLDQRDHAAADAGGDGDGVLHRGSSQRFPRRPDAGGCRRAGSAAPLGRAGLLSARAATARRGAADRDGASTGSIPTSIDQWRALPGIGRYTAGAILSIALDQRHPILEANTVRVLSRLLALAADPTHRDSQRCLWAFAERSLPRRRCGDFNQALMELGSTLCTPRAPRCSDMSCGGRSVRRAHAGCKMQIPRPKSKAVVHGCARSGRRRAACRRSRVAAMLSGGRAVGGVVGFPARGAIRPQRPGGRQQELCSKVAALTGVAIRVPRLAHDNPPRRDAVPDHAHLLRGHLSSQRTATREHVLGGAGRHRDLSAQRHSPPDQPVAARS